MSVEALVMLTLPPLPPSEYMRFESKPWYAASSVGDIHSCAGTTVKAIINTANPLTANVGQLTRALTFNWPDAVRKR